MAPTKGEKEKKKAAAPTTKKVEKKPAEKKPAEKKPAEKKPAEKKTEAGKKKKGTQPKRHFLSRVGPNSVFNPSNKASPLFVATPKNFSIGNHIPPKKDLTRVVKWPKYIRLQRQKKVLQKRLKVPPAINQFSKTLDKPTAAQLFKLLVKYKPEDDKQRRQRIMKIAKAIKEGKKVTHKKPFVIKYGLNHVTHLIEQKKAQLVVIAHDVDPIELVVWLPTLCRKMDVPYCIVKGKARLGQLVHKKNAAVIAVTRVRSGDRQTFSNLIENIRATFNQKYDEARKQWGGGILSRRSRQAIAARQKIIQKSS